MLVRRNTLIGCVVWEEGRVKGDSPQEMWALQSSSHSGSVTVPKEDVLATMATRSHGLKWVITGLLSSILKFPQVSPNGFLSSMTHQRLLFDPILSLGVWQMGLSIPCSVCIQFIILCSFYTVHSPSSWSKQILYANPSVEKKKQGTV